MDLDFPRLRENLWQVHPDSPWSFVETTNGIFEVPTDQAVKFLKIRSHCTKHNSVATIAERSAVPASAVAAMLGSLCGIDLLIQAESTGAELMPLATVHEKILQIASLWAGEMSRGFIGNELPAGNLPKTVLIGWLIETYHYVRDFPNAIAHGAMHAAGALRELIEKYAEEERGHESFVAKTLENIGLTPDEVTESKPLVSTRLIGFLLRELFAFNPTSVLLVAALVEAQDAGGSQIDEFRQRMEHHFDLPPGALVPYFEHQALDAALGHHRLLQNNLELFDVISVRDLDTIVDGLHDLKHAFDLQSAEIKSYYQNLGGRYLPRQPMTFAAL